MSDFETAGGEGAGLGESLTARRPQTAAERELQDLLATARTLGLDSD